jgi:ABC-2 type transport system permease protein
MNLMKMVSRVTTIAGNTFLEAVRQRFFNSILTLALAMLLGAHFFQQFNFGASELKFIADFGFGAIFFFGAILAITAMTQLFFSEMENRTALTLLAKPVYRIEFLLGKFFGAQLLMAVFCLVLSVVLMGVMYVRESALMESFPESFADGRTVQYWDCLLFGFIQWIKFGVLSAIALVIASFSNTNLYTVIVSFFVLVICQLQYIAQDAYREIGNPLGRFFVWFVSFLFPNFQVFNIGEQLFVPAGDTSLGAMVLLGIVLYGVAYTVFFLFLALLHFRNREI